MGSGDGQASLHVSPRQLCQVTPPPLPPTSPHLTLFFRVVAFAQGDKKFLTVTDKIMGQKAYIHVYTLADNLEDQDDHKRPVLEIEVETKVAYLSLTLSFSSLCLSVCY